MTSFTILDNAVASSARVGGGIYKETLGKLSVATKQADGSFAGQAVPCDKPGQVLCFRSAAKDLGLAIVTRKQADGKTLVMRVNAKDVPARKAKTAPAKKGK